MNASVSRWLTGLFLALLLAAPSLAQDPKPATGEYRVNPGDVLEVSVWREDYLQKEVLVRPDGAFSMPLVGEIQASGRTLEWIRVEISKRLEEYIPDPVVTVAALALNGNKIFVIGQVNKPGEYVVNPAVDVLQALALAGGTTPFASVDSIKILRRDPSQQQQVLDFRLSDIERSKRLQQNVMLEAGDVVIVP